MLVKTDVLIGGHPVWIQLESEVHQRDPRYYKRRAEEFMKYLINMHDQLHMPKVQDDSKETR